MSYFAEKSTEDGFPPFGLRLIVQGKTTLLRAFICVPCASRLLQVVNLAIRHREILRPACALRLLSCG